MVVFWASYREIVLHWPIH